MPLNTYPAVSGGTTISVTADRALVSNAAGTGVNASTVTTTELAYVSGVTSAVQTQLTAKLTQNAWATFTPTVTLNGAGTVPVYTTNSGRYVIIGKTVFVDIFLDGDGGNEGSGAGYLLIALPTAISANHKSWYNPVGWFRNGSAWYTLFAALDASATTLNFIYLNGTAGVDLTAASQNNTTRTIRIKCFYEID